MTPLYPGFGGSIPVLRLHDETETRRFYLEFLGYSIDWEHRFTPEDPESPLYLQVRHDRSVFHLNGHADDQTPPAEVRIPVSDLPAFESELGHRPGNWPTVEAVDPRDEGKKTDLNLLDPSGNLLTFWWQEEGDLPAGDSREN